MKDYSNATVPRLFEIMQLRGLSAKKVSDLSGVPASNFTEWRSGRNKPGHTAIMKISKALGVPVEELMPDDAGAVGESSPRDRALQDEIRQLSEEQKNTVLQYIRFMRATS